ncbi:MAG: hypothetical protein V2J24_22290 [Pseudomonadales bacterium]|nr:hypothetical protein [Pseudomonadales bacterium]
MDGVSGFATRKGRCEIRGGALELSGEDPGSGVSASKMVLGYGVLGAVLLLSGFLFLDASHFAGIIFPVAQTLFGFWLVSAAWRGRRVSDATSIRLDRIASVDENAPLPGRRGHFMVHFTDDEGRRRRRLVMLPEHADAAAAEAAFETAAAVLREARSGVAGRA